LTVLDSSVWLQFLKGGPLLPRVRPHIRDPRILVPTVVLYEVFKVLCRDVSPEAAREAIGSLKEQEVVALDERLALQAADVSLTLRLSMADAIVYATAQVYDASLVTCDKHFAGLPGVEYIEPEGD